MSMGTADIVIEEVNGHGFTTVIQTWDILATEILPPLNEQ